MNKHAMKSVAEVFCAVFATVLLVPLMALAAGGDVSHDGIPASVWYQVINFTLFIGAGIYFLRKPIKNYFSNRESAFKQALVKAQAARQEAEQRKSEIQARLNQLQTTAEESIAKARAEAEALRDQIVRDASEISTKLREDAKATANAEIERARHELREDVLAQAVALSRKVLTEKMAEPDQKRLQTEFVDKIQVVGQ
jgi:F-type H+-transporting ATPase subunit b